MRILRRPLRPLSVSCGLAISMCGLAAPIAAQTGGQVVVRVVTRDGQPVTDLKPGDLSLRVDGKPRDVKGLELVQPNASAPPAAAAPAVTVSTLPAPFTTNSAATPAPKGTREILMAVDDEGIGSGREQPIRDAVKSLIEKLSPGDRVGVIAMKQGGLNLPPNTNHAAVIEALPRLITTGSASESEADLACRTKVMLGSLHGFLRDGGPERSVVFVSAGMVPPSMDSVKRLSSARDVQIDNVACEIRPDDYDALGRTALTSASQLFVVAYIEGVANGANRRVGQTGLESIAGVTGAEYIVLSGSPDVPGTRISKTAGIYYLADVEGSTAGARRVDAQVARDGVRVAARPVAASAAPGAALVGKAVTPKEMIATSAVFRDLPLRSAAYVSRLPSPDPKQPSKDLKVMVLFEPETAGTKLTGGIVGFFNQAGKLVAQWTGRPEELARAPVTAALTIPPGSYRMRVAATADSKAGTTDTQVDVQLDDLAPLKIGDMILGGSQGGFVPKLAFTSQDAAAVGLFEIYGVTKDTKLDVTFEIVKDEKTELLGTGPGTVANGPGEDARIVYGGFGLSPVEPGDYLLRAVVTIDGKKAGMVTKTIRKVQ
jgi:hypothetical protein